MKKVNFSEIKMGYKVSFSRVITLDDIKQFVSLTGDNNPIHINKEYGKNSKFNSNIVHGMLLASFFSKIVGIYFGDFYYLAQTLEFRHPAFIGDNILIEGIVESKSESTKIIQLKTIIRIQNKILINGQAKIQLL